MTSKLLPLSVAGRDVLVRQRLEQTTNNNVTSLLVTDLNNIRWLTGFTGSAGTLFVRADDMVLIVDGRYGDQSREQSRILVLNVLLLRVEVQQNCVKVSHTQRKI